MNYKIKLNLQQFMDPRPYHYEYRRPRWTNPTYQSVNLYQSLYHKGILNRYENQSKLNQYKPKNQFQRQIYQQSILKKVNNPERYTLNNKQDNTYRSQKKQYTDRRLANSVLLNQNKNLETERPHSNKSNKSNDWNIKEKSSILASYGKNTMQQKLQDKNFRQKIPTYDHLNRYTIFQKQQKPYNIIGNYPRSSSTELHKFPKLTLENKLIEQGRYKPLY